MQVKGLTDREKKIYSHHLLITGAQEPGKHYQQKL